MARVILIFVCVLLCAQGAIAGTVENNKVSSPSRKNEEPAPSIGIVSVCAQFEEEDPEEYFWCTVKQAIKEKNLSHCNRDMWASTRECLNEVKKEYSFTIQDCQVFQQKFYRETCESYVAKQ